MAYEKLKPLSINDFTITDTFDFADEIRNLSFSKVDVTAIFTNAPLNDTISVSVNQLFQFDGQLYEQTDGVTISGPPLLANVFMCHLEENLALHGLMPHLYRRCVDDTLSRMSTELMLPLYFLPL